MKRILPFLALALLLTAGCTRKYVITLNNGTQLGAQGKPRFENGTCYFKDARGNDSSVSAGRVSQIEPASQAGRSEKKR